MDNKAFIGGAWEEKGEVQVQVKEQEQKMTEQSVNDLNQIWNQIHDIKNQAGLTPETRTYREKCQ